MHLGDDALAGPPWLVDTHAHIYDEQFSQDIEAVLERAAQQGVRCVIVPATRPQEFASVLQLAERFPGRVYAAIGIHPHHAGEVTDADLDTVERLAAEGKAVAVGETGLDYHYNFAPRQRQHDVFRRQLRIAKQSGLPAVIHNRESDQDVLDILEEEQDGRLAFQLHCFSSGPDQLKRALDLGSMISFTGNITFKKSTLDHIVRSVPDHRLMLETDAPYMTPAPHRGKRNEPLYVRHVAQKAAELRGQSLEQIYTMTTSNAKRFFRLMLCLLAALGLNATAQQCLGQSTVTVSPVDTGAVQSYSFPRWIGIGGHISVATLINHSVTEAQGLFGPGLWVSLGPLEPIGWHWLRLDITYTVAVHSKPYDSLYQALTHEPNAPPNYYRTLNFMGRFIANPGGTVQFFSSLGVVFYFNEYGMIRYFSDKNLPFVSHEYLEHTVGFGGSVGIAFNIKTPYGLVSPTAEWHVNGVTGKRVPQFNGQELILSQQRVGILLYPDFGAIFK